MTTARRAPLALLLLWAAGAAAWNLEGVRRIAGGLPAIGPTATIAGAGIILLLAALLLIGQRWSRALLLFAAATILLASGYGVWGALTGDPSSWPSPAWRWGGALLNGMGAAAAAALLATSRKR